MKELIDKVYEKYGMKVDYDVVYRSISSLIREFNYLKETYYRVRLDDKIGLIPSVLSMPGVIWFNHLFTDDYFSYNLQNAEYHKEELENFYKAVLFIDRSFYIDESWDLKRAKLLKKMLKDEDLNKMCLQAFGKKSRELVKESSFYYKDDVWRFVSKNKLLPYMRKNDQTN